MGVIKVPVPQVEGFKQLAWTQGGTHPVLLVIDAAYNLFAVDPLAPAPEWLTSEVSCIACHESLTAWASERTLHIGHLAGGGDARCTLETDITTRLPPPLDTPEPFVIDSLAFFSLSLLCASTTILPADGSVDDSTTTVFVQLQPLISPRAGSDEFHPVFYEAAPRTINPDATFSGQLLSPSQVLSGQRATAQKVCAREASSGPPSGTLIAFRTRVEKRRARCCL